MEKKMSAESARALAHRIGRLEGCDEQTVRALTRAGPVLELGDVKLAADAWNRIPGEYLCLTLSLHECGHWGTVCDVDWARNERSLRSGGSVVSRWEAGDVPAFWIVTDTSSPRNGTDVYLAFEAE